MLALPVLLSMVLAPTGLRASTTAGIPAPVAAGHPAPDAVGPRAPTAARDTTPPDSALRLRELVVTATRLPLPANAVPADVTVLSGRSLRARGEHQVLDALRDLAGVNLVQEGPYGSTASLFMRGGESDFVRVLVDGIPVNQPGGAVDLSTLTTDNVQRIEVVRGPASVLYGSDAVTGVVQIFTRPGDGPPTLQAHADGGSYGVLDAGVSTQGGSRDAGYSLSLGRTASSGFYRVNNEYRNDVASAELRARPDAATDARLSVRASASEYHYPTDGAGNIVDLNAFQRSTRVTAGLRLDRRLASHLQAHLLVGGTRVDGEVDDAPDGPADTLGVFGYMSGSRVDRASADLRADLTLGASVVTAGVAYETERQRSHDLSLSQYGDTPGRFSAARADRAAYAQLVSRPAGGRATLTAGVRLDDDDAFGTFTTYRLGASLALAPGTRLRAAFGTAFKEPTMLQNYSVGYVTGNPNLRPEHARSWEVGVDHTIAGRVRIGLTWFDQQFRDLIDYTGAPPAVGAPNYYNVAGALARGLELTARADLGRGFQLRGGYTWLDTRVTQSDSAAGPGALFERGMPLLRRPRQTASLALHAATRAGAGFTLTVSRTGRRDDLDYAGYPPKRVTLPAYTRVDLSGDWPIPFGPRRFTATLRIENLLNADYQEVVHFPARGRTILLGGRVRLGL